MAHQYGSIEVIPGTGDRHLWGVNQVCNNNLASFNAYCSIRIGSYLFQILQVHESQFYQFSSLKGAALTA